jgi:hypothetical protein
VAGLAPRNKFPLNKNNQRREIVFGCQHTLLLKLVNQYLSLESFAIINYERKANPLKLIER